MPEFLVPFPPTLTPTTESQAFSGSSLSLSSNSSYNYFGHHSHASSGSAYLTDITPPITPSYTADKRHGKVYDGHRISVDPSTGPFKDLEDRERRALLSVDETEDTGYDSDCEGEDAPLLDAALFDAVGVVRARLKTTKPTAKIQRALKIMEEQTSPASESDALLDEPPSVIPSMPAMKVIITKAEEGVEDWIDGSQNKTKTKAETAIPPVEEVGPTPTQDFSFILDKDEIWEKFANNEFEKSFHEGVKEDAGRSFFPDEIKLHPANSFAFGTGNISGWREKPTSAADAPEAQIYAGLEHLVERELELVSDIPIEREAVPPSPLLAAPSPVMPEKPVLRPLEDPDWTCSPFSLGSPSLVFDTSVSASQMLISPHNLDVAPMASSPGVYDISYNNPNSPLNSPRMAISTLMYASRRSRVQAGDMLATGLDLDLPDLMRLEVAAATGIPPGPQQQQFEVNPAPDDLSSRGVGLGFGIHSSQLPESSFPSCNSLPSIYSLPSWNAETVPTTSTPPLQACNLFDSVSNSVAIASKAESGTGADDVRATTTSDGIQLPSTPSRQALSDITEESTRGLALANEYNKEPLVVGLGLGGLLESTLQSSSSISLMHSPELPSISGTKVNEGISASVSIMDVVNGQYHLPVGDVSDSLMVSSGILEHDCCSVGNAKVEPSGVLLDVPQEIRHYSPGVENWRRFCAEVEPLSVPLDDEISNSSPRLSGSLTPGYCYYSEIDPSLGLLESVGACLHYPSQALAKTQGLPLSFRYSPERDDIPVIERETSHFLTAETDPRSPVSPARQIHYTSSGFGSFGSYSSFTFQSATSDIQQSQSSNLFIDEVLRTLGTFPSSSSFGDYIPRAPPPSERSSMKSSKSVEDIGIGLPSNIAGRPPRPHDISSSGSDSAPTMMSTAEESQNLAKLLCPESPTSDSASPTIMVSEERGGSRFFFKIPRFAKRSLYAIPEVLSPTGSSPATSSTDSRGRLLSAAWSDFTNGLRSPRKSGLSTFPASTPQSTSPLAGPSGDAKSSDDPSATAITQLSATVPDVPSPSVSLPKDISHLPQPPVLVPKQSRFAMFGRLSGFSRSPPLPVHDGGMSPGVVEHLDVPRGLGIFKRRPSPTAPSDKVKKDKRFRPNLRRFQLLF